ncbi:hypothetical protein ACFOLJ_07160 [Rugamonas sp. CCM 8940]|uniref:hypothetical protein n=1 Tax=Rugamonas sp. CCM 8940 TaxID=2765359 RepID=UPI0018F45C90|nr:hypothetical protein [Rugamonas sp. CCM 8940]MBJ7310271.1 hypothetical protein [Rugamonas sp. CCM 8940]
MSKHSSDPRELQQREAEQAQQEVNRNKQEAEAKEVAGRHKNDGQKDHKGADKGPRGQ